MDFILLASISKLQTSKKIDIMCMSMFPDFLPITYHATMIDSIREQLNKDGFAVIKIPSIDLTHLKDLFARDLSEITGKHIKFPELWQPSQDPGLPASPNGMMGSYGLSQGDAAWYVRTNNDIIAVFKQLLDAEQVICSMDSIGFAQNDAYTGAQDVCWLHVDQNPNIMPGADLYSLQGIFYAENSYGPEETRSELRRASTVVVPGRHKFWTQHNYMNRNHYQIVDQEYWAKRAVRLKITAGSLLIFNSKLVHQGMYGPHRLCFMVSYGDVKDRTEKCKERKVMMYLGGHRSSHWSQFGLYHGYKWRHGEPWNMLVPRLAIDKTLEDHLDFIEDEKTNPDHYESELDQFIPVERLALL